MPSAGPPRRASVDLNADVGESFGRWPLGEDERLVPLLSSANIACGGHAGDPLTIERTVRLAVHAGVAVGAHPGYPDLAGFGRRDLGMDADELAASILFQLGAVLAFARDAGVELHHVKAHGALYNAAARDPGLAEIVAHAIRRCSGELLVYGPPGSALLDAVDAAGLRAVAEAFPDRSYEADGSLTPRARPGSVIHDSAEVARRALKLAREGRIEATDGSTIQVPAATLCLHGDNPGAADHALAVRAALEGAGIDIRAVDA